MYVDRNNPIRIIEKTEERIPRELHMVKQVRDSMNKKKDAQRSTESFCDVMRGNARYMDENKIRLIDIMEEPDNKTLI